MRWRLTNNSLQEVNGEEICIMSPDIADRDARLIKRTPVILEVVFKFIDKYEMGHKVTKGLYDEICELIEDEEKYTVSWKLDKAGKLVNDQDQVICVFKENKSSYAVFVLFAPRFLNTIKNYLPSFKSNDVKQKPLYLALTKIRRQLDEY